MARLQVVVCLGLLMLAVVLFAGEVAAADRPAGAKKNRTQIVFPYGSRQGSLRPAECSPRCSTRCSATAYRKACMFYCQKCCAKCLCVPPGTYGNKQVCPCYNSWKTKRGGPKCP